MKKQITMICLMMLAISLIPVFTQAKTIYTLADLAKLANQHSQNIKIAQDDLYIAEQEKKRALSVLIPRATVYGSLVERKNEDFSSPDTVTLGGKLTQSFTLNGRELIALDITKKDIESKTFSLDSVRAQYMLSVAQVYYNILSAQRYLEIAQADVERLTIYRDSVREKLNVGNLTKTDLYRAEAELAKSKTDEISARNNISKSRAELASLVDIEDDYELEREPSDLIKNYSASLDDILDAALTNRPEIKAAQKNLMIAQRKVDLDRSDYWPTLSLEAGYRESDISYETGASETEYDTEDLYVSAEVQFTLYDGGLRKATVRQAVAAERQARNTLELAEKEVILGSKNAYYNYDNAKSALVNLKEEVKSAQETVNAVQMQFQYGMADSIEAMDANTLLVSAQRRNSDAQYIYYFSVLNILYSKGELVEFLSK